MLQSSTTQIPNLASVVLEVLGDLAFMITDDEPVQTPAEADWLQGEIAYHGAATGTVRCWCTRGLAIQLAANLLGIETEEDRAQLSAEDALREFLNVLCGQLVTAWYGRTAIFNLSIPVVRAGAPTPGDTEGSGQEHCRFSVDGQPLVCAGQRNQ